MSEFVGYLLRAAQKFLSFRQLFNVSYKTVSDSTSISFSAVSPENFQCVFLLELEIKYHVTRDEISAGVFQGF
jgi:hypothetical protein